MRANGAAIRALRERTGISQANLARTTDIRRETLNRIESGARPGTPAQIVAIAKALSVPIVSIIHDR